MSVYTNCNIHIQQKYMNLNNIFFDLICILILNSNNLKYIKIEIKIYMYALVNIFYILRFYQKFYGNWHNLGY